MVSIIYNLPFKKKNKKTLIYKSQKYEKYGSDRNSVIVIEIEMKTVVF